jgi:hypothetical protein
MKRPLSLSTSGRTGQATKSPARIMVMLPADAPAAVWSSVDDHLTKQQFQWQQWMHIS